MPRVIAFEDAKANQYRQIDSLNTPFLKSSGDTPALPMAFLSQPDGCIKPHFHIVDEFQVIAAGKGKFGRHDIAPYCVHFARAYTPYGPIVADGKTGLAYFTLRAHFDPGANYFPESLDRLKQVSDRRPWQITREIKFPSQGGSAISGAVNLQEIPDIKDDQGLFAYSLTMAPNTKTAAPDPSRGDGQYLLVVKGSLWHSNKEHKAFTIVFVEPKDGSFQLYAGAQGLKAIILNFPQTKARIAAKTVPGATAGLKKWQCELCAFAYDEAMGLPDDGILPGTRWEDVPESWTCPDCATAKSDFQMVEVQ